MTKVLMNKLREILFWYDTDSWDNNIPISLRIDFGKFRFECSLNCFESGRVISKNDLEGQQTHNVQEVRM